MKVVVHLSGKFTPISEEIEAEQVSWTDQTFTLDCKHGVVYYPREKVVKVEVIR